MYLVNLLVVAISNSDVNLQPINLDPTDKKGPLSVILSLVWMIAAALSVLFVVIGGLKYTLSNGDPGQVSSAKNTILYAVIGLAVTVVAFTVVTFILGRV